MTERKTVLSSEKVAIRIAEIKENRYVSYYNVLIKADCIAIVLLLIFGTFFYEIDSIIHILSYLVSSVIFLFIFKGIHKEAIKSLKDLKEETENLENRINIHNDSSDTEKKTVTKQVALSHLNKVDKEMIKKLINISDFPVIDGEEDLRYISTKDKKEENKDLLKYLTNNQALLESIGITKITNYYDIAVVYKIDKFVMNYLK